ncbi:MAG: hypothetical protein KGV56_05055, partial [Gammaproteobacteria bacterium]|nr:hypothetical protein [Gammaproteobacteria bacterium]
TMQTRIMTTATNAAKGAMALLGGPVGILVTVVSSMIAFGNSSDDTRERINSLRDTVDGLTKSLEKLTLAEAEANKVTLSRKLEKQQEIARNLQSDIDRLNESAERAKQGGYRGDRIYNDKEIKRFQDDVKLKIRDLEKVKKDIDASKKGLDDLNAYVMTGGRSHAPKTALKQQKAVVSAGTPVNNKEAEKAAKINADLLDKRMRITLSAQEYAIWQAKQKGYNDLQIAQLKEIQRLEKQRNAEKEKGATITNRVLKAQQTEMKKLSGGNYLSKAMSFLRQVEGFSTKSYWDVNHYRTGYGSDTVTRADGSVHSVTKNTTTTRADAERDLVRRLNQEFVPSIKRIIGSAIFDGLTDGQKVAMIGLRYRGDLRKNGGIAKAARAGDMNGVVKAIEKIASKQSNAGVKNRLMREARLFGGGELSSDGFVKQYQTQQKAQAEAQRKAIAAAKEMERQIKAQQDAFAGLSGQLQTAEERRLATLKQQLDTINKMQALKDAGKSDISQGAIDETRKRLITGAVQNNAPNFAPQLNTGVFGGMIDVENKRSQLQAWHSEQLEMLQTLNKQKLISEQEYATQSAEIEKKLAEQKQYLHFASQDAMLAAGQATFAGLANYARAYAGENSTIYRAMFAAEKAFAIARAAVAIQQGIAMAAAQPYPANLAAMASVASATGTIISTIASIAMPQGMAHNGIDKIPKDGTWLLQKGERVTTAQTSAKLDKTLSQVQQQMQPAQQQQNKQQNIRIVNSIDPKMVESYLGSDDGERLIMNVIGNNPSILKQAIGAY